MSIWKDLLEWLKGYSGAVNLGGESTPIIKTGNYTFEDAHSRLQAESQTPENIAAAQKQKEKEAEAAKLSSPQNALSEMQKTKAKGTDIVPDHMGIDALLAEAQNIKNKYSANEIKQAQYEGRTGVSKPESVIIKNSYKKDLEKLLDSPNLTKEEKKLVSQIVREHINRKPDLPETWLKDPATKDPIAAAGAGLVDIGTGLVEGIYGTFEGLSDLILHGAGYGADLFGAEGAADYLHGEANYDSAGNLFAPLEDAVKPYSPFGSKTEQGERVVGNFVGQMILSGATAGAGNIAPVIAQGASAAGSGISEAYNAGATDEEALAYGLTSGAWSAITESVFGGLGKGITALGISKGIGGLDDIFANKVTNKIKNILIRNAIQLGIKASGEGLEEVLDGLGSAVLKKMTYMSDKDLGDLIANEKLLDSFLTGMVLSAGAQAGGYVKSVKNKTDFITERTDIEESVVKKEAENRIKEQEAKLKKELGIKEKNDIYDKVVKDLEKGYISTDVIEEVLGGDIKKAYDGLTEEAKEYETLYNTKASEMSKAQQDRLAELEARVKERSYRDRQSDTKNALRDNAIKVIKGERGGKGSLLAESYNEGVRRGQRFTADLSAYDEKQRATVQRAIDSGVLNNTNRSHDFVDMVAKLEAEKGVKFDFANNAKLKESGFALDGKVINGVITDDGITINIDSPKALGTVVGHEIAHVLEGTELYKELQSALFEYAESKGEYKQRLDSITSLYKGVKADIKAELTADLIGDYIFSDADFVRKLSAEHRNIFEKIYDEIKYLLKIATAGSKEARELERVKRAFEKAYKEGGKASGDTKYSMSDSNENLGYHAGDLGKAESLGSQGYGRGTGHFGRGTYFVGNKELVKNYNKRDGKQAPQHAVDFTDYNLYKVKSDRDGYSLHENLKVIDGGINERWIAAASRDDFSLASVTEWADIAKQKFGEDGAYSDEGQVYGLTELAKREGIEIPSKEQFAEQEGYDLSDRYLDGDYAEHLKDIVKSEIESINEEYARFRDAYFDLNLRFGFGDKVLNAMKRVLEYQNANNRSNMDAYQKDSLATVFMKSLGYEGVDTRGTALDNVAYGSVIYDLKENTVKYSLSDSGANADTKISTNGNLALDKYTEKQYNTFGWARDAEAISKNELDDMYSKIHEKGSLKRFAQSSNGEAIIEVNDDPHTTLGVNNVFVFAKGTKNNPEITRVVRVNFFDEASVDVFRKDIYANTNHRTLEAYARVMGEELVRYYDRNNSANYGEYANKSGAQQSGSESEGIAPVNRNGNERNGAYEQIQTNEITPYKASSEDGVFFDGDKPKYSLSKEGDTSRRDGNIYGGNVRFEAPVAEDLTGATETAEMTENTAPIQNVTEPRMKRADSKKTAPDGMEERSWYETSTGSKAVDNMITPDDIPDEVRYYQVKSNEKTLATANARLARDGYAKSREYFEGRMSERKLTVEDIALGERLIQEAAKAGDSKAVMDLIIDVSIIGTELGQRVQALSMIRRLTPEGQLKALTRTVERGKAKGDKAFEGVEITQEMIDYILKTYGKDGTYDQTELNKAVEDVKQQIADQMHVGFADYINAWRYLSMLGNPKTHIRNVFSNVAMFGTRTVKNAIARTAEDIFLRNQKPTLNTEKAEKPIAPMRDVMPAGTRVKAADRDNIGTVRSFNPQTGKYTVYFENKSGHNATVQLDANILKPLNPPKRKSSDKANGSDDVAPVNYRTKTWRRASDAVKSFAKQTTKEMESVIKGDNKYSDEGSIKAKRNIFKTKVGNWANNKNTAAMEFEDSIFSKQAFQQTLSEYLTANGIKTEADIKNNPALVEKAKDYALEEAHRATFRQDSWVANKISEIERKNLLTSVAVGSIMPFKKTPINIAKTGLAYSPLGFARNIYDAVQVSKGKMDASEAIDHLAQSLTGTALAVLGYVLADMGVLSGAGEDDKEGKYDYQLGEQSYSLNWGGNSYSLSWLSPVSMPLFAGANAYEQLVEDKDWDADVVMETLAQTLDPMSEMSFLSSLDDVLSSYDSGVEKFAGIAESMGQSYVSQFIPTLSSQIAQTFDDTKRSTKPSKDSGFTFGEETLNKIKYKIPGLRNTLEPATDIWGNEIKQSDNVLERGFEAFLSPASRKEYITTAVDEELKALYGRVGESELLPAIPDNYINYEGDKYEMSARDYTEYKEAYGQTAFELMEKLFDTETYKNADSKTRADMVKRVYDYARDNAKLGYFTKFGVDYTNAQEEGEKVYKENPIKGAIEADLPVDEYVFSRDYPKKYEILKENNVKYKHYINGSDDFKEAYTWASNNPEKYKVSKVITDDVVEYRKHARYIANLPADKDKNGNTISGSRQKKVVAYINGLDLDAGAKYILYKMTYPSSNDYNAQIVKYLDGRDDISYDEMVEILTALGMKVNNGRVTW